jgi:UDP-N-acetylmuramoyl-L-alanyl-D-glutamate--2,6-diaminopimelate ligase
MAAYFAAKKILFEQMVENGGDGVAVINIDDFAGKKLAAEFSDRLKIITFGFSADADFRASEVRPSIRGQVFALEARGKSFFVRLPVVGRFNVLNALAAMASVSSTGVPLRDLVKAVGEIRQTPGRMEFVGGDRVSVFVDYAHTPDALEKACETLSDLHPNRLITIFGCGGDRDRSKRPLMAEAASRHSQFCIVTSDNPRNEEPQAIIDETTPGLGSARHEVVIDRREAIYSTIENALPGDLILIAGKGHETYQEVNGKRQHFDDREVARRALEIRKKKEEVEFAKRQAEREERERKRVREDDGERHFHQE